MQQGSIVLNFSPSLFETFFVSNCLVFWILDIMDNWTNLRTNLRRTQSVRHETSGSTNSVSRKTSLFENKEVFNNNINSPPSKFATMIDLVRSFDCFLQFANIWPCNGLFWHWCPWGSNRTYLCLIHKNSNHT